MVRVLVPSWASFFINWNWWIDFPSMEEVDPKYLDGMSELCIFISLFIFSSDDCIIIEGMLLLLIIFGIPSSLNCHDIMYASHLSISSLPPDVKRRCSHVWAACYNLFKALVRLLLFQSFAYCLLSSMNPRCFIHWSFLSGEFIRHPSHFFSITFVIETLLNTQLVPAWPDPWPCPWIGVVLVDLYVFLETPWLVWILHSILFN